MLKDVVQGLQVHLCLLPSESSMKRVLPLLRNPNGVRPGRALAPSRGLEDPEKQQDDDNDCDNAAADIHDSTSVFGYRGLTVDARREVLRLRLEVACRMRPERLFGPPLRDREPQDDGDDERACAE